MWPTFPSKTEGAPGPAFETWGTTNLNRQNHNLNPSSRRIVQRHRYLPPQRRRDIDQRIQREPRNPPPQQIVDPRLRHAASARGFSLRPFAALHNLGNLLHQPGAPGLAFETWDAISATFEADFQPLCTPAGRQMLKAAAAPNFVLQSIMMSRRVPQVSLLRPGMPMNLNASRALPIRQSEFAK